ncbi:EAL domain-containing protein [Anaerocolumna sp. AGMB13025]|uniref:EAL domain-containing protein n=1 Tax=Anaerocolumna sp. AGMB13025 TaxID=3039116 RepID=UPI00241D93D9|nr:EAL domain-containing protein [Anaerocolumna sp. AGMB13025]WFR59806.1 EAL domain-containing protein [Anaerocolumna sp. AGMB13025]
MKELSRFIKYLVTVLIIVVCISSYFVHVKPNVAYSREKDKHVLFISSYSESFLSVPDQIKGIREVLDPLNIQLDVEFMDTKRFDTKESKKLFYDLLKYKLDHLAPYDGILVGDDNALQFVMDYQEDLFKELPIVFLGVNDFDRARLAASDKYITGIVEEMSLRENIQFGLKINKEAKRVVAIVDDTLTGRGDSEQFYQNQEYFKQLIFDDINVSQYTFSELEDVFESIGKDTILLYLSMYTDKNGDTLTIPEAVDLLREHTHIPILRAEVGGVGKGILGGKMVNYLESGKIAAGMLCRVFDGTPVETIAMITDSPNTYTFDYQLLKKFKIDPGLIPENSVLINKKISFYEQHKQLVLNTLFVLACLVVIVIILTLDNIKRRRIEKALQDSNEELTQTFEELTASEEELRAQYDTIQEHNEEIETLNQKYSVAIESTDSAVWEYNLITNEIHISKKFINDINKSLNEQEDVYKLFDLLLTCEEQQKIRNEFNAYKAGEKEEINIQLPIYDQNSNLRWVLVRGKGFKDINNELRIIHGIILDITKMKEQEAYIEYLAVHDYLTNLPNRLNFMNKIKEALTLKKKGAVLLLDIDNFKSINDTLGHFYGDMMLLEIASKLSGIADEKLFVSRFGGDEFLILISDETNSSVIEAYADKIIKLFEEPLILNEKENYVKFSIGITCFPEDSDNIEHLMMNADTAMYCVKRGGKNNYMFYNNDMQDELKSKTDIEMILRSALKEDGLMLVFQPQVNVLTGDIVGFEALLRLKNYRMSPDKFIPIAEETGLIHEIGRWVTEKAIKKLADWKNKGFKLKPVAINFSSKQINDSGFLKFLEASLIKYEVDPSYLEIEITESILIEKTGNTIEFLKQLRNIGTKLALDDFGTGYTSLNYLTFIPVNKIKLDKSLCEKFLSMDNLKAMDNLIALVHSLELAITAEGIEDMDQLRRLKNGGCDYIQGYLFSKPLQEEEVEKIYNHNFLDNIVP